MDANNDVLNDGSGRMAACFRHTSSNVHSVILPPQKLEFGFDNQEWVQREVDEVCSMADDLFGEVSKALIGALENITVNNGVEAQDSCHHQIAELEGILKEERMGFEEMLGKMLHGEDKNGQQAEIHNILEINHLRRQLVLHAHSWEQRLLHIASSYDTPSQAASSSHGESYRVFHSSTSTVNNESDREPGKNLPDALDAAWTGKSQAASSKKSSAILDSLLHQDEPSSIISYALLSPDYHAQISNESEKVTPESSGSESSSFSDPSFYSTNVLHPCISFSEPGPEGKVEYRVTCYYARQFEALKKACCISELDFIHSLSRSTKCNSISHAKTLDNRLIVKVVGKKELESFIMFAPSYFKYLSDSIASSTPTCLAKIFGIYEITSKNLKDGKESKTKVLVMENLMLGHNITRMYDLKGSSEPRHNQDPSENNKVLFDQNLVEEMPTNPIYVGSKAKRLLEKAVWNDTAFLASVNVMEYSLLVGLDDEKHELVVGVIDYRRQYTWDKQLETWVKTALGVVLGGTMNASSPTVISPTQYKKRFRKAMSGYFIMVPDEELQCEHLA
ncbi:1-phosphatidylinositol-3-phosphate 5-kinase FAB1B isoform X2 [Ipomoea triloba]|uniref:1-phosphatidylinositol-3-phosphate 5-kinase FAB1B isoform X2 n=1 Tax=Ipomoea triloba TaxID=35885 RepID=UPI00125CEC66|nr:1-phosphatidylinositol-3-phosphate 5-kinase FAB1B isoform X2 [Ipomoea triloba]